MMRHYTIVTNDPADAGQRVIPGGLALGVAIKRADESFRGDFCGQRVAIFEHQEGHAPEIVAERSAGSKVWRRMRGSDRTALWGGFLAPWAQRFVATIRSATGSD